MKTHWIGRRAMMIPGVKAEFVHACCHSHVFDDNSQDHLVCNSLGFPCFFHVFPASSIGQVHVLLRGILVVSPPGSFGDLQQYCEHRP